MARPAGDFDASRYFRGGHDLGFYNVGTAAMRALARSLHAATRAKAFGFRPRAAVLKPATS